MTERDSTRDLREDSRHYAFDYAFGGQKLKQRLKITVFDRQVLNKSGDFETLARFELLDEQFKPQTDVSATSYVKAIEADGKTAISLSTDSDKDQRFDIDLDVIGNRISGNFVDEKNNEYSLTGALSDPDLELRPHRFPDLAPGRSVSNLDSISSIMPVSEIGAPFDLSPAPEQVQKAAIDGAQILAINFLNALLINGLSLRGGPKNGAGHNWLELLFGKTFELDDELKKIFQEHKDFFKQHSTYAAAQLINASMDEKKHKEIAKIAPKKIKEKWQSMQKKAEFAKIWEQLYELAYRRAVPDIDAYLYDSELPAKQWAQRYHDWLTGNAALAQWRLRSHNQGVDRAIRTDILQTFYKLKLLQGEVEQGSTDLSLSYITHYTTASLEHQAGHVNWDEKTLKPLLKSLFLSLRKKADYKAEFKAAGLVFGPGEADAIEKAASENQEALHDVIEWVGGLDNFLGAVVATISALESRPDGSVHELVLGKLDNFEGRFKEQLKERLLAEVRSGQDQQPSKFDKLTEWLNQKMDWIAPFAIRAAKVTGLVALVGQILGLSKQDQQDPETIVGWFGVSLALLGTGLEAAKSAASALLKSKTISYFRDPEKLRTVIGKTVKWFGESVETLAEFSMLNRILGSCRRVMRNIFGPIFSIFSLAIGIWSMAQAYTDLDKGFGAANTIIGFFDTATVFVDAIAANVSESASIAFDSIVATRAVQIAGATINPIVDSQLATATAGEAVEAAVSLVGTMETASTILSWTGPVAIAVAIVGAVVGLISFLIAFFKPKPPPPDFINEFVDGPLEQDGLIKA